MIKKTMYPKTERVKINPEGICEITEKIDGSNLCIFKFNNELHLAQRNAIFTFSELESIKGQLYKGLYGWVEENKETLYNKLIEGSCICGEWLGMGKLNYNNKFPKKFYMFAKANVNENMELYNLRYYHDLFIYPFASKEIPSFIGVVPIARTDKIMPTKLELDEMYKKYCAEVDRNVEGFVVNYMDNVTKYVRMKNGKLAEHFDHES